MVNEQLTSVARAEMSAIIAWVRNTYIEEQPFELPPTESDVIDALRAALLPPASDLD